MSEKVKKESKKNVWPLLNTVLIVLLGGFFVLVMQKNHMIKVQQTIGEIEEFRAIENKITELENKVKAYQNKESGVDIKDVVALNEKIDNALKVNMELLDSKASLASVAGAVERVDRLEQQVERLGKVSSQGALILTAAGLVENAAKNGKSFMYEASVLEELSRATPMEKSAQIISQIAVKGLPSREDLIENFMRLYEESFLKEPVKEKQEVKIVAAPKKWYEVLKEKLSALILIEKIKKPGEFEKAENQKDNTDEVYRFVRNGEFEEAVLKMNSNPAYQTERFGVWIEDVRVEKVFNREMEKIKALTLGVMKTENLR